MQVPNGAGPGVRRSKRPLLASRTRCNVLWKPPKFGNKVKIGYKVQFGNKFANWCNVWSIVTGHGHVPDCHVTFGKGRLHNVWWDPQIDHKTSWGTISNVPCPREGPGGGGLSRECEPPYPQRDRKRRLNGAVCRNHRIKRLVPCRC